MVAQKRLATAFACGMAFLGCGDDEKEDGGPKDPILVAAMIGRTGSTAALAVPTEQVMLDYVRRLNERGGIDGHKIEWLELPFPDTMYLPDGRIAIEVYDRWREDPRWPDVDFFLGWGSVEQFALLDRFNEDKKPMLAASMPGPLTTPTAVDKTVQLPDGTTHHVQAKADPYQFCPVTDLSSAVRIGVEFLKKRGAKKIAFTACETFFCQSQLPAGKIYAAELGLEILEDVPVEFTFTPDEVDASVKDYLAAHPDVEWIYSTSLVRWSSDLVKAAHSYKPELKILMNPYGFDDTLVTSCGNACPGRAYGVVSHRPYGDARASAMEEVTTLNEESRELDGKDPAEFANMFYVRDYMRMTLVEKAARKALEQSGEITAATVHAALESMKNEGTGGLSPPITITPEDHRPNSSSYIYSIADSGKFQFEDEVQIPRRSDWIGW